MALLAHRTLGCRGVSRADFRYDDTADGEPERLYLLEVNTQPGMTPLSLVPEQATHLGISIPGDWSLGSWSTRDATPDRRDPPSVTPRPRARRRAQAPRRKPWPRGRRLAVIWGSGAAVLALVAGGVAWLINDGWADRHACRARRARSSRPRPKPASRSRRVLVEGRNETTRRRSSRPSASTRASRSSPSTSRPRARALRHAALGATAPRSSGACPDTVYRPHRGARAARPLAAASSGWRSSTATAASSSTAILARFPPADGGRARMRRQHAESVLTCSQSQPELRRRVDRSGARRRPALEPAHRQRASTCGCPRRTPLRPGPGCAGSSAIEILWSATSCSSICACPIG